jgi:NitT/TauT family transport system substrate-binding protein
MNDATDSSNALISGDLDAAGYTVNRYAFLMDKFKQNNVDVAMPIIINRSSGGDGIIADADINSIKDLVGKKVGVPRFSEAQTLVEWFVSKSDLTDDEKSKIEYVYFDTPDEAASAYFAGEINAAATWQPYLAQAQESTDSHILIDTSNATSLVLDGIVFRQDYLDVNADTVEKFIRATLKAYDDYNDTDYTALRNNMSMFSSMSDEEIADTLPDATLLNWNENMEVLADEAVILYRDMSNIWNDLGETAYPDMAEQAFTTTYMSACEDLKTADIKTVSVTAEQKEEVKNNSDNYDALINAQATINFKPNSAVFADQEEAAKALDEFVDTAKMLDGAIIMIEGNSANTNGATENSEFDIKLTEQRAKTVANYFISKGIDNSRFITVGNGIGNQIADNSTEEGRAKNRRTDIKFIIAE